MPKAARQRIPDPEEMDAALGRLLRDEAEAVGRALVEFDRRVGLATGRGGRARGPEGGLRAYRKAAFLEWLCYDFALDDGQSVAGRMAFADASLVEFAGTQLYARFWVVCQDPTTARSLLRRVRTGEELLVCDAGIASTPGLGTGMIGARVARAEGAWACVSELMLHDAAANAARCQPGGAGRQARHARDAFITDVACALRGPGGMTGPTA